MVPVYYEKPAFFQMCSRIKTWARFIKFGRPISVLKLKAEKHINMVFTTLPVDSPNYR